jgi:serine/threonine protein kinase
MSKDWKLDELLLFFYEIAMALYDLSKYNILHLDIKPENILIQSTGQYVVCDLGCSRKM